MQEPPFIAVGGGLAGAAFALELARNGAPVSVLESTRGPHHKVCGEFLSAEAQGLIAYLGIDLAALGATSIGRFGLAAAGRRADAPLPFLAAGLSCHRLDQALLQAAEKEGAVVERGVTVSEMKLADGCVALRAGSRTFTAKAVALATGKHALRQYPRRPSDMVGFRLQLRLAPGAHASLENVVQLVMFNGGYVGALIVEDRLANFCWVLLGALLKRIGADWPSQAAYFAAQSELLGELLRGAEPCWDKPVAVAAVPYGYLRTEAIAANILPVAIPSFHRRWHGGLALFRYRRGPGGPGRRSSSKLPAPPHRSAAPAISRCVRHQPAVRQRHSKWACGMDCLRSSPPRHLARAIDQAQGFRRRDQARANARGASFLNVISMEQCDLNGTLAAQRFDET
jgi:hypothetical protein